MIKSYIAEKDGWLYVVSTYGHYDTPVIKRYWYPLGLRVGGRDYLLGKEVEHLATGGVYRYGDITVRLAHGNSTEAKYIYEVPLKPPRGKDVYWTRGAFYKYTKTHGEQCLGRGEPIESAAKLIFPKES